MMTVVPQPMKMNLTPIYSIRYLRCSYSPTGHQSEKLFQFQYNLVNICFLN